MTRPGIDYVETKLGITPILSGPEKVKQVIEKSTFWGWEQIKDIGAKVLAEMAKI